MVDSLCSITDTLINSELLSAKQIDVHIDALLHRRDVWKDATNVKERLHVAPTEDGSESLTRN